MRNFKELTVWRKGMEIVKEIYLLSPKLPANEKFALVSQIQRAAVSIPSNIAEGASRESQKEFRHLLQIALGSAYELETQILCIEEIHSVEKEFTQNILMSVRQEQKMISALIKRIKNAQ